MNLLNKILATIATVRLQRAAHKKAGVRKCQPKRSQYSVDCAICGKLLSGYGHFKD
jgi:hypothetical protein